MDQRGVRESRKIYYGITVRSFVRLSASVVETIRQPMLAFHHLPSQKIILFVIPFYLSCGYMAMWLCGYMAMWLNGFVAMWLCGYVARWLYGCMVIWIRDEY